VRLKWNLGNPKVEMNLCEWIFYGTAGEKVFKLSWVKAEEGPYTLSYEAIFYTKNEIAMAKVNTFFKALLRGTRKVKIYGKGAVCP